MRAGLLGKQREPFNWLRLTIGRQHRDQTLYPLGHTALLKWLYSNYIMIEFICKCNYCFFNAMGSFTIEKYIRFAFTENQGELPYTKFRNSSDNGYFPPTIVQMYKKEFDSLILVLLYFVKFRDLSPLSVMKEIEMWVFSRILPWMYKGLNLLIPKSQICHRKNFWILPLIDKTLLVIPEEQWSSAIVFISPFSQTQQTQGHLNVKVV